MDHLKAIRIHCRSIAKGINIKNFGRFWVPRYPLEPPKGKTATLQFSGLFGAIIRPKAAQMGTGWTKSGFPKGLLQQVNAGKGYVWSQKSTLPASVTDFFFLSAGVGGRLSSVRVWQLPAYVQCRFTTKRTGLWCSAQCIHGLAVYRARLASTSGERGWLWGHWWGM